MCGIIAFLSASDDETREIHRRDIVRYGNRLNHRGPDSSGIIKHKNHYFVHKRLSLVGRKSGRQPIVSNDIILVINGEIYNHEILRKKCGDYDFRTRSDCEVIIPLYLLYGANFIQALEGMFAFVLYDKKNETYLAARDHVGMCSLYEGRSSRGLFFASELKSLADHCNEIQLFPPGFLDFNGTRRKWYEDEKDFRQKIISNNYNAQTIISKTLLESVKDCLMSDNSVRIGCLLSGGLDSSLIATITQKLIGKPIHTFCIGLKGSPDLEAAKKVSKFIGSQHHSIVLDIQDFVDAVPEVIESIETFDVTTVRASVPLYLLARTVKSLGISILLSGEGADELFGGYMYFRDAPNEDEFFKETLRKVQNLHMYDCLRAHKAPLAWGVEARFPFLQPRMVSCAMRVDPKLKMHLNDSNIEKKILRDAFYTSNLLPDDILMRRKEQFSDGVGYDWIDRMKEIAEHEISENLRGRSKESILYERIFETYYPSQACKSTVPVNPSISCSTEHVIHWNKDYKKVFDEGGEDSGRASKHHPKTKQ